MALSLIAVDGYFVVVLAAWWRLRRSAYLLPHRRRGPSSFVFHPGNRLVVRIMAIITVPVVLILRGWRLLTGRVVVPNGQPAQTRLLLGVPTPDAPPAGRAGSGLGPGPGGGGGSTAPIPVSAGPGPASPLAPPLASRAVPQAVSPPIPEPRCPSWTVRGMSGGIPGRVSGGSVEPPTCPLPVVRRPSPGHTTVPIGRSVGPPRGERGSAYAESLTGPTRARQPASARRGPA